MRRRLLAGLLAVIALSGCARALGRAETALYGGRYDEAAARFQEVLNENPDSVDARVGLGIAKFPDLYLGLIALLHGQDAAASERLGRYAPGTAPCLVDDVQRAFRALGSGPATPELRAYVAASLEDQAALAGELSATQNALRDAEPLPVRLPIHLWDRVL